MRGLFNSARPPMREISNFDDGSSDCLRGGSPVQLKCLGAFMLKVGQDFCVPRVCRKEESLKPRNSEEGMCTAGALRWSCVAECRFSEERGGPNMSAPTCQQRLPGSFSSCQLITRNGFALLPALQGLREPKIIWQALPARLAAARDFPQPPEHMALRVEVQGFSLFWCPGGLWIEVLEARSCTAHATPDRVP